MYSITEKKIDEKSDYVQNSTQNSYKMQIFNDDVWINVLEFLPIQSFSTVSLIDKQINKIQNNLRLWKTYAKSLNIDVDNESEIKKQVIKEYVAKIYREKKPLFWALEQIIPYDNFVNIPTYDKLIPEDILNKINLYPKQYLELSKAILTNAIYKISDNWIVINVVQDGEYLKHSIKYSKERKEFSWVFGAPREVANDCMLVGKRGSVIKYKKIDDERHKVITEYLLRLFKNQPAGTVVVTRNNKDENVLIEKEIKLKDGKSLVQLCPDNTKQIHETNSFLRDKHKKFYE